MTDRYSTPSSNRFHVWPAGSDSYHHDELQENWDLLDAIIGFPSTGDWPPVKTNTTDGGIYREVARLQNDRVPIGTIISWFRPTSSTPVPATWHVCDGSVLTTGGGTDHDFPGISGSVTLPDLRNKFILGADPTPANQGNAAVAVSSGDINAAAGAPGAQATGGSNKIVQTANQMPSHDHDFTGDEMDYHRHYTIAKPVLSPPSFNTTVSWSNTLTGGGGTKAINDMGGISGATSSSGSANPMTGDETAGTPTGTISSTGSGDPMDNRPSWVGLIFLVKVLYSTTP